MSSIAIILPAYNEACTIQEVMKRFHHEFPDASLYVINNASTDQTYSLAQETLSRLECSGAVINEPRPGKGNAIRRAFLDVDADIYLMADADLTYAPTDAHQMIELISNGSADMVLGNRHANDTYKKINKRRFHNVGNNFIKWLINTLFQSKLNDMLTGFRCFNHRFVKTFPILSEGFEIETEMNLHALDKRFRIIDIPISYADRPDGSESKLNTTRDGIRITSTIFQIFRYYRPMAFFTCLSLFTLTLGIIVGTPVIIEFYQTKYITKVPSATLASSLVIISIIYWCIGLILDTVVHQQRQDYELNLLRKKSKD